MRRSPTPHAVATLLASVPQLNVRTTLSPRVEQCYSERCIKDDLSRELATVVLKLADFSVARDELSKYTIHTAVLGAVLTREELAVLLARAYEAGCAGR